MKIELTVSDEFANDVDASVIKELETYAKRLLTVRHQRRLAKQSDPAPEVLIDGLLVRQDSRAVVAVAVDHK